ncbi:MAG: S9 family peptidase [bacterium]|nr:S9 family peptidase [bacterium]
MLKKIVLRSLIVAAGLLVVGLGFLAVHGLPKPSSLTVRDVPRLPWSTGLELVQAVRRIQAYTSFGAWLPQGRGMLVYAVAGGSRQLHLVSEPGARPEKITSQPDGIVSTRACPDPAANCVVFSMDHHGDEFDQLYRLELADRSVRPLTANRAVNAPGRFNHGGDVLIYTSTARNGEDWDIYRMDPSQPQSARLLREVRGTWIPGEWSPEDDRLLVRHHVSANESRLFVLDAGSGELTELFPAERGPVAYGAAVWTANGDGIYYVSDRGSEFRLARRYRLASGRETVLTRKLPWDVEDLALSPSGRFLALLVNVEGCKELYLMDTDNLAVSEATVFSGGTIMDMAFHPVRDELALTHRSESALTSVYSYDLTTWKLARRTYPASAEKDPLPVARLIHYPTFDAVDGAPRQISAFVLDAAPSFSGPRPVLVEIHGGPEAQAGPIMTPLHALMRRRGITVISPNVRGSSGYGKTFLRLDDGYRRGDAVKDIGALLDWIAEQKDLDETRVAVAGASYGGYMVLASLAEFGHRLRCGIDLFGISNFVTFLENTEDYRRDRRRQEYGDERDPKMRAFLESISPRTAAQRIQAPSLIYAGKNDPRVPVSESRRIAEELRTAGRGVWYIEAADEGHSLSRPLNQLYVSTAGFAFLDACLLEGES